MRREKEDTVSRLYPHISVAQFDVECSEGDAAVGLHLALEAGDLAGGELVHARVVRVVHVVVDRVDAAAGAGVAAGWAARRGRRLRRRVGD